jgi:transglutaminase-like putative cysteine protease
MAQGAYEPPVALERFADTFDVNADGTYREVSDATLRIETPSGISDFGVQRVPYASSRETLEVLEAWIVQPDGSKIVIHPESIRTQEEGTDGGSTSFSDTKYKVIVFPQVRVGSRLHWKTQLVVHTPLFEGQFWDSHDLSTAFKVEDWEVTFNVPAGHALYVEKRGVEGGLYRHTPDTDQYRYSYRRPTSTAPDEISVSESDYADGLQVSTLPDVATLGHLFYERAAPMAAVTEDVRALATKLTGGTTDDREKAKALYSWVAKNIRYVSVTLGTGGWVPHAAAEVLSREYGDCKDHTILLQALLAAVGIESVPALVNLGDSYTLSTIGSSSPINHVITYLPAFDLFVDSTTQFAPFGTLPFFDSDKPVVLTSLGRVGRTPPMAAQVNRVRTDVSMTIRADGSIDGSSSATMTGQYEIGSRATRFDDSGTPSDQIVKGILTRFGETGRGALTHTDPQDTGAPYWIKGEFHLDPVSNVPGRGAFRVPVGVAPGSLAALAASKPAELQQHPWPCVSRTVIEHYIIQFPKNVRITDIPAATTFRDGSIWYTSTYLRTDRQVTVDRQLVVDRPSQVCTAADRRYWSAFDTVLQRDLRSQVFYK